MLRSRRDGHFRIPNLEESESQTIRDSFCSMNRVVGFNFIFAFFLYFVAYLFSYHEKAIKTLYGARLGVASHLFTTPKWGIPLSVFSNSTTDKLAGLFFTLSLERRVYRYAARVKIYSHLVCFILLFSDHAKTSEILLQ